MNMDKSKQENYFIIEFDDGIQLVPQNWMIKKNTEAYWPNFTNNMRYDRAVRDKECPEDSWQSFPITKILATAQTYEKGKQKLKEAEVFSEVNSSDIDEIETKLRRRKRARLTVSSSEQESDVEDDTQYELNPFPSPPTSGRRKDKIYVPGKKNNTAAIVHNKSSALPGLPSSPGPSFPQPHRTKIQSVSKKSDKRDVMSDDVAYAQPEQPSTSKSSFSKQQKSDYEQIHVFEKAAAHNILLDDETHVQPEQPSTPKSSFLEKQTSLHMASVPDVDTQRSRSLCKEGGVDSSSETSIIIDSGFRNYQRFVIKTLLAMNKNLKRISETVEELSTDHEKQNPGKLDSESGAKISDIMKQFPLTDLEAVEHVEQDLIDEKFRGRLMTALAKIGGPDIKTKATRLMERLFSNCVAEKFSWIGGKKKLIFSNLLLCGVILDVVRISTPKATDDDISIPIKNWLRHAKERLDRQKMRTSLVQKIITTDENQNDSITDQMSG